MIKPILSLIETVKWMIAHDKRALELFGDFAHTNHTILQAIAYERGEE